MLYLQLSLSKTSSKSQLRHYFIDLCNGKCHYILSFFVWLLFICKREWNAKQLKARKLLNISVKYLRVIQAYRSCPQTLPTMGIQAYWKKYQIRRVCYHTPAHDKSFHTASISMYTWERVLRNCFSCQF